MPFDSHTLELLEFGKIRDLVAGYTVTSLGKELAHKLEPLSQLEQIEKQISLVTEMTEALSARHVPPLSGVSDVRLLLRRATIGSSLTPTEINQVKDVLTATGSAYRYRMKLDPRCNQLINLLARVEDNGSLARTIEGSVDARAHILDMASSELSSVRHKLHEIDDRIQQELKRILRDSVVRTALRFPNATLSGDHYVLPVAVNHRQKVPGIVHRTSATGDTVYIEPAALSQFNAERSLIKVEEEKEIAKVLRRLTAEIARVAKPLQIALEVLAQVDVIQAKAKLSLEYQMCPPKVNTEGRLWLNQARHPLLLHLFRQSNPPKDVVPIDIRLGSDYDMLIITGPNTGGKTVALKTVGLLCLMAQSGMHFPAQPGSMVPVLDHLLADIGDEQSLEQSLSTFSSHITRIRDIFHQANDKSLVLLDELGAGTDPTEGAALGRAILDHLAKVKCLAMVTTHLGELKTYAFHNQRAENAAVEFDVASLQPTYRLLVGQFGRSCALQIARRLELPKELMKRAQHYLRKRRERSSSELEKLQAARESAEKARHEAHLAEVEAEKKRQEYEAKQSALAKQQQRDEELKRFRETLRPGIAVAVERFDQPGQVVRVDQGRGLAVIKAGLGQWEVPLREIFPGE
ncbi:MAG: DNA strand exchange inhibitor protein [Gemmatales bacterium]